MENKTEEVVEEQLTEIEQKRLENIESAYLTSKLIIAHENYNKNKKFKNYDVDLIFKSRQLNKELDNFEKKITHKVYKRGQVVSVNFGTNIGSEISGEHFAIVLTKYDKPTSRTITVVPLTSKYNENYISLGKEVWDKLLSQILKLTYNYVENYKNIYSPLVNNVIDYNSQKNESNDNIEQNDKSNILGNNNTKDLLNIFSNLSFPDSFITKYHEIKSSFDEHFTKEEVNNILSDTIPQEDDVSKDLEKTLKLAALLFKDENFELFNNMFQCTNEIYKIIKSYVDKDKDSYAIINQITTISKYKIRKPISDNDPLKRIKISKTKLDIISDEIIKQFTNKYTK